MYRISVDGVSSEARAEVEGRVADADHLSLAESGQADAQVWLLEPGAPQPGEPANLRPIMRALWIAAQGDTLICRPRESDEASLLVHDLDQLARCEGMRAVDNPGAPPAVTAVEIIVVDANGDALAPGTALADGAVCDFVVRNGGLAPVWVALLELGADRTVGALYPEGIGPGEKLEPGESLAFGAEYLARLPDFASDISVGQPADFPWVVQPGPISGAPPCVFTLKAIVTAGPVPLPLDGSVAELTAALEHSPHAWACVHRDQIIDPPPPEPEPEPEVDGDSRQISPTGSGYVLVYWAERLDGTELGHLGITATSGMKYMGPEQGYWMFPEPGKAWPSEFRLRPGERGKTTVDPTGVPDAQAQNQFFGAQRRTNPAFGTAYKPITLTQVDESWSVSSQGALVGYMARVGDELHWFTTQTHTYLPRQILEFKHAALPTSGDFFSAVDDPLN